MKKIKVDLQKNSYNISIGKGILARLPDELKKINPTAKTFFLVDSNVNNYHANAIKNFSEAAGINYAYYVLKSGETAKNFKQLNLIYHFLLKEGADRKSIITAVGGGVTGDLAGYAASTFMRGVNLIHIPTTLLAMVDSSIGGKTGINFSHKKNMVGTFYQPNEVFADINFLNTLPASEVLSGLGEVLKYAFLLNKNFFEFVDYNMHKIISGEEKIIQKVIIECAAIKAAVVSKDEKGRGLRKILNLGHTFAHAFESELNFKIKHGEAVIAGLISAVFLSRRLGFISEERLKHFLHLPGKIDLQNKIIMHSKQNIYDLMLHDKKNVGGKIKFILPKDIGVMLIDVEAGKRDVFYALEAASSFITGK